jgi:hypothetical protein
MPQKKNSVQDLPENEENEYPIPNPNKTIISVTNKLNVAHKKMFQRGNHGKDH